MPLAVNVLAVATPLALVATVSVALWVDWKVPLAPVVGPEKVTEVETGLANWSRTVAEREVVNVVLMLAVCPPPLTVMPPDPG